MFICKIWFWNKAWCKSIFCCINAPTDVLSGFKTIGNPLCIGPRVTVLSSLALFLLSADPCFAQWALPPRALFEHKWITQRLPPPCLTHRSVDPTADLGQFLETHRFPPPCPMHLSVAPLAAFVQPSTLHLLEPVLVCVLGGFVSSVNKTFEKCSSPPVKRSGGINLRFPEFKRTTRAGSQNFVSWNKNDATRNIKIKLYTGSCINTDLPLVGTILETVRSPRQKTLGLTLIVLAISVMWFRHLTNFPCRSKKQDAASSGSICTWLCMRSWF